MKAHGIQCMVTSASVIKLVVIIFLLLSSSRALAIDVVTFDDLPANFILTGTSYAGLTWETGNQGDSGQQGVWAAVGDFPHSSPRAVANTAGSTLIGIAFPSQVNMSGAYFALQGNLGATQVRASGYLNGQLINTTGWTATLTQTPVWLDMSTLSHVNRVIVESLPVITNAGPYCMDDLTFTYIPEPASLAMIGTAGAAFLGRRRRRA